MTKAFDFETSNTSSADYVAAYLQALATKNAESESASLPRDEQPFSDEALAELVNIKRLQTLLHNSDDFLSHFNEPL